MLHVIGIGSPFGDDRIGLVLIDELRRSGKMQPYLGKEIDLHQFDRPGAGLLAHLEGMERVVIIDAVMTGGAAGQLHCWPIPALIAEGRGPSSSHGIGLAQTLALGRTLGVLPLQLLIMGVEMATAAPGECLSPRLQERLPALVTSLAAELLSLERGSGKSHSVGA